MTDPFAVTAIDGGIAGPVRNPRNSAINAGAGSIHDNDTAQKLGFRGGTVAGSLHMEQFPPLLADALGDSWYETGGMSLYFKYATTDGEPVQAFAEKPEVVEGNQQIGIWMDDVEGHRVCEGTASVGAPDMNSTVRQRIAGLPPAGDLRILASAEVGKTGPVEPTRMSQRDLDARVAVITEPLAAYTDASIFGKKIITPALQVRIMRAGDSKLLDRTGDFGVGLYGAIELQMLNGPVFVEHDYETWSTILAVGQTPKTEFFFYESVLADPANGNEVMKMIMMLRFMKASSPHYANES